jgi:hypothetical protein
VRRPFFSHIGFRDPALKVNLQRLGDEWEEYQNSRDRDGIYRYLTAVFELVTWWARGDIAGEYARRALCLKERRLADRPLEPFATIILCTADREIVDYRMRSKWSRVLRYAAKFKKPSESLIAFVKRKGGINKCAVRFARRLGRASPKSRLTSASRSAPS